MIPGGAGTVVDEGERRLFTCGARISVPTIAGAPLGPSAAVWRRRKARTWDIRGGRGVWCSGPEQPPLLPPCRQVSGEWGYPVGLGDS